MAAPPKTILNTYQALLTTFTDFLVVAIHTILYERALYPQDTFLLTRAYNFPVRQNRHPVVCKWVIDSVAAIQAHLLKGAVKRVVFVIYSRRQEVLERFLFDVSRFPTIPERERFTQFAGTQPTVGDDGEQFRISKVDVEEQLRSTIRKLAYCGGKLKSLPDGCTYTIAVEIKDKTEPPVGVRHAFKILRLNPNNLQHPQPWVPSEPSLQTGDKSGSKNVGKDLGGAKTVPVRSVETGEFIFESWIEEGKAKRNYT